MIAIPAGKFLMGEDKLHEVEITEAYAIARYPVTNAQYQMFVDDGGYTESWRHCWTEAAGSGGKQETEPPRMIGATLRGPTSRCVGVTWYEAVAYARWLAEKRQTVPAAHRSGMGAGGAACGRPYLPLGRGLGRTA
jgi:formylglycine-generating enzyme required for sulfatase activity